MISIIKEKIIENIVWYLLFAASCQKTRKFDKNDRKKIFLRVGANDSGQLRSK